MALAAAVALSIWLSRRLRRFAPVRFDGDAGEDSAGLRGAVESGRAALETLDDARAAIIACYVVFTQLLLADEINRTPPKTQAALLEAMGEGQVSVDGQTRRLPEPFIVLATDNPIEYEGTYELPEAQLDRFLMRLRLGYLSTADETSMLRRRVDRAAENVTLSAVTSPAGVLAMRRSLEKVEVTQDLLDYIVAIVAATRRDPQVQVGASPRGGLALVQLARGQALLSMRDYVIPDDIKQVAVPALAHRVTLRPELWVRQVSADDVAARLLASVPTPRTDPTSGRARAGAVTG